MSTTVFEQEKSVFFAMDENDAVSQAGGCTQAWWDGQCPNGTEAEAAAAMAKLLDSTGTPLIDVSGVAYDDSEDEITITGVAAAGVEVGMVAYVIESEEPDADVETGRYKITYVGTNYIQCDGINGTASTDVDVVIGGAFSYLQDALDETDASNNSVTIHVQSQGTFVSTTIDIDVGGGNNTKNTFKKIVGFNTSPGDMNYGGTYYQSPLEILQAGSIDNTKAVLLDGNDDDVTMFDVDQDNIVIENFHLYNTGTADAILFTGTPQNIMFKNCKVSAVNQVFNSSAKNITFDSCYFHDDLGANYCIASGGAFTFLNCVISLVATKNFVHMTGFHLDVIGCVIAGNGKYGVQVLAGASALVRNSVFYNLGIHAIRVAGGESVVVLDNIFSLEAGAGAVALYTIVAGSFLYNDYNCFIESDGTPLTVGGNGSGYEVPVKGKHSVEVDPDFVDAANGDFRVRNPLLLRGGRPGPDGRAAVIGAIGQEYQFAKRARMVNQGRMKIFR